ncbi:MAG: tetratricopeptide repeat protein [Ignavibacteriales bacterium]|nr:tetratricopeptide repeat protein [Ignavibacteriales bacterium]
MKYLLSLILFLSLFSCGGDDSKKEKEYIDSGNKKMEKEDYTGAIEDFTKATEINPDNADAYYYRAFAKDNLMDYPAAIEDYSKAIKLNPNYTEAYYNRGFAKYYLGNYEEAIIDFTKAIELNPNDAWYYKARKIAKENLGDIEGAAADEEMYQKLKVDE